MNSKFEIITIGEVISKEGVFGIKLSEKYIPALKNIDGFNYLTVVWWGNLNKTFGDDVAPVIEKPYKKGPDEIGLFATRSEVRPNPILLTNIYVLKYDIKEGIIYTAYIDAHAGTPVLDIKPYHKVERIKNCQVPQWCSHWPEWYEDAGSFDWENEFNF